jgi:diguanylate cyclase (GGDEF)-like protein
LRSNSRTIDTPARYGGDEFAVILPEVGEEEARRVAERICSRLASDGQSPQISVSVGVSVYPTDGTTMEKLFGAADRSLYRLKRRDKTKFVLGNVAACL